MVVIAVVALTKIVAVTSDHPLSKKKLFLTVIGLCQGSQRPYTSGRLGVHVVVTYMHSVTRAQHLLHPGPPAERVHPSDCNQRLAS